LVIATCSWELNFCSFCVLISSLIFLASDDRKIVPSIDILPRSEYSMSKMYSIFMVSFDSLIFSMFWILMFVFISNFPSKFGFLSAFIFVNFEPSNFIPVILIFNKSGL